MLPKKPNRWKWAVKSLQADLVRCGCSGVWYSNHMESVVYSLLRKEHAAVVRMVKNALDESVARDLPETGPGYQCACRHIIDQLKRRTR